MRACVETYGCTLNFGEARVLGDLLLARGWGLDEDHAATLWFIHELVVTHATADRLIGVLGASA